MYHQFNSSVNSPSNSSFSNSLYYNSPMASSDYAFDSYNQQVASVQSNESYLPYQWSSKSTYDWSKYFYPNSYNQSPICASTTSISSNKSFDTSFYDLSSYNNSSFTNYSNSSIIQSTPSSSANQYQVIKFILSMHFLCYALNFFTILFLATNSFYSFKLQSNINVYV